MAYYETEQSPVHSIEIGGVEYAVNYGFKTGIQMDIAYHDKTLSKSEQILKMMKLLYGCVPGNVKTAVQKMLWFYTRGKYDPDKEEEPQKTHRRTSAREFCFKQDADIITAAFLKSYGLWLSRMADTDMHWWEFMGLFNGLPDDTMIKKYIYYRTVDISDMSKEEKKRIKSIRSQIRVRDEVERQQLSQAAKLAQRNAEWLKRARLINQE